jgi:hypothetical protein
MSPAQPAAGYRAERDTPRDAVRQVPEKVNTGGITLTVFELLTATFAADEFDLRQHREKRCRAARAGPEYRILSLTGPD